MRKFTSGLLALALAASALPALAAWPDDRAIEIVVGFAPGGGTDTMARVLARFMEKRLGPQARLVVVNKPGAGGELAISQVLQARPDGYALAMVNAPGFVFLPMVKKTAYQPEQLRLVGRIVDDPSLIVARKDGTAPMTMAALVQKLKQSPSSLSFGHSGDGTTGHLALLQLERLAGVKVNSVPYKGAAEARLALLGGHIDYVVVTSGEVPDIQQPGSPLAGVAQFSEKRGRLPLPTVQEAGYDVRASSERGLGVHHDVPPAIAQRLQEALAETLKDPAFLEAARNDAPVIAFMPGDEWAARLIGSRPALQPLVPLMGAR